MLLVRSKYENGEVNHMIREKEDLLEGDVVLAEAKQTENLKKYKLSDLDEIARGYDGVKGGKGRKLIEHFELKSAVFKENGFDDIAKTFNEHAESLKNKYY